MLGIRSDGNKNKMERRIRRHVGVVEKVRAGSHGNVIGARSLGDQVSGGGWVQAQEA